MTDLTRCDANAILLYRVIPMPLTAGYTAIDPCAIGATNFAMTLVLWSRIGGGVISGYRCSLCRTLFFAMDAEDMKHSCCYGDANDLARTGA
jgi:hypothetical protein